MAEGQAMGSPVTTSPNKKCDLDSSKSQTSLQRDDSEQPAVSTEESHQQLVGPRNEDTVVVNGVSCSALIDTGSQITSVTDVFVSQHAELSCQKLESSDVVIEGATAQEVPYVGVVNLNLKFLGQEFLGVPAFVVPTTDYRATVPLLVGTNVIRASRDRLKSTHGGSYLRKVKRKSTVWYDAFKQTCHQEFGDRNGRIGSAKYTGRRPCTIPPESEMHITCSAPKSLGEGSYTVLVEGPTYKGKDTGLITGRSLGTVVNGRVVVRVCNLATRPLKIHRNTALADVYVGVEVTDTLSDNPNVKIGEVSKSDGCGTTGVRKG